MQAPQPDPMRRNEHSRRAILDAAISLINELGYDNVSIEAIAARARVGKQTIYRWWPSKGAVVLEAATRRSVDLVVRYPDTGDVIADLRLQLSGILDMITTTGYGPAYRGLLAASQSDPDLSQALFDQIVAPNFEALGKRMAAAKERGELPADADISTLGDILFGVIEYRMLHALPIDLAYVDALLSVVFDGVR